MRTPAWLAQHLAALRVLLVLTAVLGVAYPLLLVGVGRIPGVSARASGSMVTVGSTLIGQSYGDNHRYYQGRPSASD